MCGGPSVRSVRCSRRPRSPTESTAGTFGRAAALSIVVNAASLAGLRPARTCRRLCGAATIALVFQVRQARSPRIESPRPVRRKSPRRSPTTPRHVQAPYQPQPAQQLQPKRQFTSADRTILAASGSMKRKRSGTGLTGSSNDPVKSESWSGHKRPPTESVVKISVERMDGKRFCKPSAQTPGSVRIRDHDRKKVERVANLLSFVGVVPSSLSPPAASSW